MRTDLTKKKLIGEGVLLLTAALWGFSFIFQRRAMEHLTPFAYMGLRFLLGGAVLLPHAIGRFRRGMLAAPDRQAYFRGNLSGILLAGLFIFGGSILQQYGLLWTTVAKAGFITSLYVVLVPIIMLFFGRRVLFGEGLGAGLALIGLFLLSVNESFRLGQGDVLVLIGAFIWAGHVICLGFVSPRMDSFVLGAGQALVCGVLGLVIMAIRGETPLWSEVVAVWPHIVGGGIFSVALGFTLQVYGQRDASPTAAAIILQLESVFAAIAGVLILSEVMTARMIFGCAVMLAGVLVSQLWPGPPGREAPGGGDGVPL
ncbi:MAG: DMT family transporter [Planctomycetes bacterium]|nr:DMT family transporter [Planctomycetota bacterium]